jgi:hypothetical protein
LRRYGDIFLSFDVRRLWRWGKEAMDGFIVGNWIGFWAFAVLSVRAAEGCDLLTLAAFGRPGWC